MSNVPNTQFHLFNTNIQEEYRMFRIFNISYWIQNTEEVNFLLLLLAGLCGNRLTKTHEVTLAQATLGVPGHQPRGYGGGGGRVLNGVSWQFVREDKRIYDRKNFL